MTTSIEKTNINKQSMNQNNIKPQELRIGNWAQYNGVNYQIYSINIKYTWISTEKGMESVGWEEVFPIPISEEVLLKCGFSVNTDDSINHWFELNSFVVDKSDWNDVFVLELNGLEIKYLHQLQNLFYDLTQTELEISWN